MNINAKTLVPPAMVKQLESVGIMAVLVVDDAQDAVPLARLLIENGIRGMELTLRTSAAFEALEMIRHAVPEMFAGVGTVLTTEQVLAAKLHGSAFGVAPGYNSDVVAAASAAGLPFAPGVATPSEIEGAFNQGCQILKFFHAEGMGGAKYLQAINAPYKHLGLRYIPLGGLGAHNLRDYLALPEVVAIGGSWIAPQAMIKAKDWTAIARNAKEASSIFEEVRGES